MPMPKYNPGDHVKIEVTDQQSGETEWMWLLVDTCNEDTRMIFGKLDNIPVVNTDMSLGQDLAVSFDKVRDHRPTQQAVLDFDAWLLQVKKALASINMGFDDWQGIWPYDFEKDHRSGVAPKQAALNANTYWWKRQNESFDPRSRHPVQ